MPFTQALTIPMVQLLWVTRICNGSKWLQVSGYAKGNFFLNIFTYFRYVCGNLRLWESNINSEATLPVRRQNCVRCFEAWLICAMPFNVYIGNCRWCSQQYLRQYVVTQDINPKMLGPEHKIADGLAPDGSRSSSSSSSHNADWNVRY